MHRARLVLLLGAAFYSAWIIAPLLGSTLSPLHSYVSEVGAAGQPYAQLFRSTDILAGTCFVIAAALAWRAARPTALWPRLGLIGVIVLGTATICDALMPLSCTPTADAACAAREAAYQVPLTHMGHAVSSGIAGFGGVVAVLAWWLWRRRTGFDGARARLAVGAGFLVTTVWTLAAMPAPVLYLGLAQRLQIITLTAWLVLSAAATSCRGAAESSVGR
ncbi:hypothetical protein GCM10027289_24700 [Tsukamurella serpentis]